MALNRTQNPEDDQRVDRSDTAARILDVAERLVQLRGFNGFSYADIAAELHITKASLHYHYAGKAELGRALIERYAERFTRRKDPRVRSDLRRRSQRTPDVPVRNACGRVRHAFRANAASRHRVL